jgi:hypothetical protein
MANLRKASVALGLLALGCFTVGSAQAFTFTATSGSHAASADFVQNGSNLQLTLTNTSTADVLDPTDVLTAVFFDIKNSPTLTPVSAVLANGSTVLFPDPSFAPSGTDPGGVVGGEWAYKNGLSGAPGSAKQGVSSTGLNLFGPGDLFPGSNLQGPVSPDGIQYGITSAGDNPATGNTPVTGANALIKNSVVFTLSGMPEGCTTNDISNVWFQYGTALTDPSFPGDPRTSVPEPGTWALLFAGLVTGVGFMRRRPKSA